MKFSAIFAAAVALVAQTQAAVLDERGAADLMRPRTASALMARKTSTTSTTSTRTSTTTSTMTTTSSSSSSAKPSTTTTKTSSSTTSSSAPTGTPYGGLVFAHYMLLTRPPNGDYTNDINMARAAGIDAFAVNYGGWNVDYNTQNYYLHSFFDQAAAMGFKCFLSIDLTSTAWWGEGMPPSRIIDTYNGLLGKSSWYQINGKPILSTFQNGNPNFNWKNDVLSKLNTQPYFLPANLNDDGNGIFSQDIGADGYFPWIHPFKETGGEASSDQGMASARSGSGKKWMAALSPWFFKRFDWNNNWAHAQDGDIFVTRALNLLKLKPDFIELVTWNDWGESTYFGPADDTNVCQQCYWAKVSHYGALEIATSIIKAYKAGWTTIDSANTKENVWIYYRQQPKDATGWSGDNGLPLPMDWTYLANSVYVVGLFNKPTMVTVTTGGRDVTLSFPAGMSQQSVPWTWGQQAVSAWRDSGVVVPYKSGPDVVGQKYQYDGNIVYV